NRARKKAAARMSVRACIDFGTALSKAAAVRAEGDEAVAPLAVRPLALGLAVGERDALTAPGAIFVENGRVHFGARALERAEAQVAAGREALMSFKSVLGAPDLVE